ncbi:TRAP transporter substrate-binding protein [Bacillus sp. Marseille-P3661]|uniref:TRAP transporter substrate-binding protein n=1 Tax=Bacillus sp. Marseille-P3661 TaxID=1936234 RepID=UPI000C820064|nr:TRAP transporter substrate-binding protein [Bacillus sp. Marseille-P3661]
MKGFTKSFLAGLFVMMFLFVSACNSSTDSSGSTNEGGGEKSNSETSDVKLEFKMGHMNSPNHVQDSMAMTPFSEEVAELTGGAVNFKVFPGGALGGPKETYDNIVTGIMDAGWGLQGYNAGKFPIHSVLHLPFLANGDGASLSVVAQKLYDQFPEIQAEYSDVQPLWFHAADPYAIITKDKAVRSFEDIKGLKLRTPSVEGSKMLEAWGATPVSLPAPEIYDAMQKGVIDGGVLPVAAINDFTLTDVVDYVTLGNFNTSLFYVVMNKDSWNKVPAEQQEKMKELMGVPMAQRAGEAFDFQKEQAEKESKDAGVEFIELPEEELQKFKDAAQVVTEEWISEMESKGIPGQEIYDTTVKLIEEGANN